MSDEFNFDWDREVRTGVPEAVLAETKSNQQLVDIVNQAKERSHALLLTRMNQAQYDYVSVNCNAALDYDPVSRTLILGTIPSLCTTTTSSSASETPLPVSAKNVGIVAAGTSDIPVAAEVMRTLHFFGIPHSLHADVGVAGLWRLTGIQTTLEQYAVIIAVAGMEGALFSVLSGLVNAPIIAVPTSVGYGVANGGTVALHSALASCSPGIVTVNIDNGFGAAAAAKKMLSIGTKAT